MLLDNTTLVSLVNSPESQELERKPGVSSAEVRKALSAFANSTSEGRYSVLLLGVGDRPGTVIGVTDEPDKLQKTIVSIADGCYPPIPIDVQVFDVAGKRVVAVIVAHSKNRPHFTGQAYVRRGSMSQNATDAEYDEFVLDRIDKARRIAREKALLSVEWQNSGVAGAIGGTIAFNDRDYRIVLCDAHVIELQDQVSGIKIAVPMDRVTISRDPDKNRMKLIASIAYPSHRPTQAQIVAGMERVVNGLGPLRRRT